MARPLRIEYNNAYYHVMNRGAAHRDIFTCDKHREIFLNLLKDIHEMFRVEIHAYCLMDNHYHLLLSTPDGNLSRAMRHLNGVYTQRFNRLEKSDGPLFRGRFKSILIDADSYLLSVSRYIHLNPFQAGLVKKPGGYEWSSYRQFIGEQPSYPWLNRSQTLKMVGVRNIEKRYQAFVVAGIDTETCTFYENRRASSIMGDETFINQIAKDISQDREIPESRVLKKMVNLGAIVDFVATELSVNSEHVLTTARGRGQKNLPRSVALFLSRKYTSSSLNEIASYFGLNHYGSVSGAVARFEKELEDDDQLRQKVHNISKQLINRFDP